MTAEKMRIEVKPEHIEAGERLNAYKCPIVLAALDAGMEEPAMNATLGRLSVWIDHEMVVYANADAGAFARHFDEGETVKPQTFEFVEQSQ